MTRDDLGIDKFDVMYVDCGSGWYPEGTILQMVDDDGSNAPLFMNKEGDELFVELSDVRLDIPLTTYLGGE